MRIYLGDEAFWNKSFKIARLSNWSRLAKLTPSRLTVENFRLTLGKGRCSDPFPNPSIKLTTLLFLRPRIRQRFSWAPPAKISILVEALA